MFLLMMVIVPGPKTAMQPQNNHAPSTILHAVFGIMFCSAFFQAICSAVVVYWQTIGM